MGVQLAQDELWNKFPRLLLFSIHLPELSIPTTQQAARRSCILLMTSASHPPGQGAVNLQGPLEHDNAPSWPPFNLKAIGGQESGQEHRYQSRIIKHQAMDSDKILPPTSLVALGK